MICSAARITAGCQYEVGGCRQRGGGWQRWGQGTHCSTAESLQDADAVPGVGAAQEEPLADTRTGNCRRVSVAQPICHLRGVRRVVCFVCTA